MADNDNLGDEYQFADIDAMDNNEETGLSDNHFSDPKTLPDNSEKNNIKRIFLIFIPMLIVAIVLFKIFNAYFGEKQPEKAIPNVPVVVAPRQPENIAQPVVPTISALDSKLNDRISALDEMQRAARSDMATMNDQLNTLGKSVDEMVAKIEELNIIINNLGNEDISHITKNQMIRLLRMNKECPVEMIKMIHFNANKPENHNVYKPNFKDKYVKYCENNIWKIGDLMKIVTELYLSKMDIAEEKFDELKQFLEDSKKDRFQQLLDNREEPEIMGGILKRIIEILYNEKSVITDKLK